ncbi:hypothetical protein COT62_03310 [Candidatus Roizmanbacteria bacterium CG09_land_8_20_14_0_10_41_9]|uniref:Uncharacterized protein n=1 Tax=Candidatus Roizmanbacteria bacterium CG09_land_8_20_14_0_10_41_9 TaxID=1974850 RepID=A0A2H0WS61_9BACT|nr:MAG: hypothetical protein COT62_03310 [Candidatus Roizmanbacteria bacterium CG09_land_8_20_14_0_10_41_9]
MRVNETYGTVEFISRLVIIIPIAIILGTLFFKYGIKSPKQSQPDISQVTEFKKESSESKNQLNLTGPFFCSYTSNSATMSAYINNRQIFVQLQDREKEEYHLVSGDCYYHWNKGKATGEKTCGISSYLLMADQALSLGLVDFTNLSDFIPTNSLLSIASSESQMQDIMRSCVKRKVDPSFFTVPKIPFQ